MVKDSDGGGAISRIVKALYPTVGHGLVYQIKFGWSDETVACVTPREVAQATSFMLHAVHLVTILVIKLVVAQVVVLVIIHAVALVFMQF